MKRQPKIRIIVSAILMLATNVNPSQAQTAVHPTSVTGPVGFAISGPLRDNPVVSPSSFQPREIPRRREVNPDIRPPDYGNMPLDPGEQKEPGWITGVAQIVHNYAGQNTNLYPPDANGDVNETYYFQVVNLTYAIYNKSDGSIVAGPSALNSIFNPSLPGANCNDGDPVVLWDEHAGRWLFAEFSVHCGGYYMLIAVSTSSDPTDTWYSWSFPMTGFPDYPKLGIWQDGYYMATNTPDGNDVYVFKRDAMLAGDPNVTMIGFDNPNRPSTWDNFHCILPLDNDGPWAPTGTPGQFITIADDGQGNPADQLWLYELHVDWVTPSNSTFARTQTLNVNSFSGNFNSSWNNIPQPGTSQRLDGISEVLMHRAQYRNFNGTQKIVCNHTIAESADEAAIRWYELQNTGSGWSIVQQGTYNPDNVSRWMASIAMNDVGDIAMGYSVSDGSSTYPGIRYCGHTHSAPAGVMDVEETVIWNGSYSQTFSERWGDYSNISIDPTDGITFWFTTQYKESSTHTKGTRIAAFSFQKQVALDQQRQDGTRLIGTTIGRWNGVMFDTVTISTPPPTINSRIGAREVLRGYQQLVTNPSEKYRLWKRNTTDLFDTVQNHRGFTVDPDLERLTSRFHPTDATITIKTDLIDLPGTTGGNIQFRDPWYIDSVDASHGNNLMNRGMQHAVYRTRESTPPDGFKPNFDTPFPPQNHPYRGVFLNQVPDPNDPNKPYYSVGAPNPNTIAGFTAYFQNWTGTNVTYRSANKDTSAIVFTASNATATTLFCAFSSLFS